MVGGGGGGGGELVLKMGSGNWRRSGNDSLQL